MADAFHILNRLFACAFSYVNRQYKQMAMYNSTVNPKRVRKIFLTDLSIGFAALTLFLIGVIKLINMPDFQLYGNLVSRVETSEKVVALTFDDGPLPGKTEEIVSILDRNNVKATFYLIGNEVEKYPEQTRHIINAGHELGNHSYSHFPMVFVSHTFIKNDIEKTDALFRTLGYSEPTTFRPPYGDKFILLPKYLSENNRTTITWDIAPDNEKHISNNAESIKTYTAARIQPGSIIILHPMYKHRHASLLAVEPIIKDLKAKGYKFVTVSELLKYR